MTENRESEQKQTVVSEDEDSGVDLTKLRSLSGSLRYSLKISDSVLLKLYALIFFLVGGYITILWILALIVWLGRLQNAVSMTNLIAHPALNLTYIAVMVVLTLPMYIPMRRYRKKLEKSETENNREVS